MENSVYEALAKKSRMILALRLVFAVLFILGGIIGTVLGVLANEKKYLVADAAHPVSDMRSAAKTSSRDAVYAKIESDQFIYSGVYVYEGVKKDKPVAYVYFVPVYDEYGDLVEVVTVEGKKSCLKDEDMDEDRRPVRTFKGKLEREDEMTRELYVETLLEMDFTAQEAEAYLSDYTISRDKVEDPFWWVLSLAGLAILGVNLGNLKKARALQQRMEAYGVTEPALRLFEEEYRRGHESINKVDLTEHWLFDRETGKVCVLPLQEVVWLHKKIVKHYTNGIYSGSTFTLELYFSDKGTLSLSSKKANADSIMDAMAARCPQALQGFSPDWEADWKADPARIVNASREKAWLIHQAAQAVQEEKTSETANPDDTV